MVRVIRLEGLRSMMSLNLETYMIKCMFIFAQKKGMERPVDKIT